MNETNSKFTPNTLRNIAHEVQAEFYSPVDNCFRISEQIQELMNRRFDTQIGIRELQIGETRATHYVNTLPMSEYANGTDSRKLLIDASISQFTTQYAKAGVVSVDLGPQKSIPEVALYEPGCEERKIWYCLPNDTNLLGELSL